MSNWTPHAFKAEATKQNVPAEVIQELVNEGNRLRGINAPVIFTLGHLAAICDVPYKYLRAIVERKFDPYRIFNIRKRSGGYRQITVPEPYLIVVQRWIHSSILSKRTPSVISTAFAPKTGPVMNAQSHIQCRWLVKVDVRRFFESISERQVYHVFRRIGYPALLAFEMTRLCTRFPSGDAKHDVRRWKENSKDYNIKKYKSKWVGHLPQGAPTSPMLANLVCEELDKRLIVLAQKFEGTITRYADDIVFSAGDFDRIQAKRLIREISSLLALFGFVRNDSKTQVSGPGSRRVVTGLLVDSGRVRLPNEFRDNLRMHLFHARTKGVVAHCRTRGFRSVIGFREHLRGLLAYSAQVDYAFASKMKLQFDALPWKEFGI